MFGKDMLGHVITHISDQISQLAATARIPTNPSPFSAPRQDTGALPCRLELTRRSPPTGPARSGWCLTYLDRDLTSISLLP